jgi:hypothetical protein
MARLMKPWILPLLVIVLFCRSLSAAEEIRVPFNFRWGDSTQVVEDTLAKTQAKIVDRLTTANGRNVLVVEGHPDPRLKRSQFYFDKGSLVEIELQYGDPTWDSARVGAIFEQTRRNLDRKYGTSRNIARERTNMEGVDQTVIGYQWTQSYTSLRLFLYTAEQGPQAFRMLSYHYRGF